MTTQGSSPPTAEELGESPSGALPTSERLPDDALMLIFHFLAADFGPIVQATSPQAAAKMFGWFRRTLPVVSRRWNALLQGGGKYSWESVLISVEYECCSRRRRLDAPVAAGAPGSGHLSPPGGVGGSSPTAAPPIQLFTRASLGTSGTRAKLRSASVVSWTDGRSGGIQHLLLDFGSASHDFEGSHALEALLRAANRGPRGLRTLRMYSAVGGGGQDSYEMLGRLRGLAELHASGLPQGFLAGTLPYLTSLTALTRLTFTPEAFQFPVTVPTLPPNLQVLLLSQLWINRLPAVRVGAPRLRELALQRCFLVEGVLSALADSPSLEVLRLDGSSLTDSAGGRIAMEASRQWPPCGRLRALSLASCMLRALPAGCLGAFPALEVLDLSNNPDLGGAAAAVPDPAAAAAAAACLPPDLARLTSLAEVRLAGCGLTAVPSALLRIPSITALDFSTNSLSALPLPLPLGASVQLGSSGPAPTSPAKTPPAAASVSVSASASAAAAAFAGGFGGAHGSPGAAGTSSFGGGANGSGVALFADRLVRLNIALNRFTVWPQGLLACSSLQELVLGAPLVARAAEGDLERCVAALPALRRLEVRGATFEPRAVRSLLALQRAALGAGRPLVVEVTGV